MGQEALIAEQEGAELVTGRHAVLLNQLAALHKRTYQSKSTAIVAVLIFQAYQVIVSQEIELRQAIADKCARPMVETL